LIVLIERVNDLGRTSLSTDDAGEQRLNDVVAENRISGQLCDAIGRGAVTTGFADTFHQTFAADFGQIVSGMPAIVGGQFCCRRATFSERSLRKSLDPLSVPSPFFAEKIGAGSEADS
jgi:hypothetical protein